jgi:hypothetical protein
VKTANDLLNLMRSPVCEGDGGYNSSVTQQNSLLWVGEYSGFVVSRALAI